MPVELKQGCGINGQIMHFSFSFLTSVPMYTVTDRLVKAVDKNLLERVSTGHMSVTKFFSHQHLNILIPSRTILLW